MEDRSCIPVVRSSIPCFMQFAVTAPAKPDPGGKLNSRPTIHPRPLTY